MIDFTKVSFNEICADESGFSAFFVFDKGEAAKIAAGKYKGYYDDALEEFSIDIDCPLSDLFPYIELELSFDRTNKTKKHCLSLWFGVGMGNYTETFYDCVLSVRFDYTLKDIAFLIGLIPATAFQQAKDE